MEARTRIIEGEQAGLFYRARRADPPGAPTVVLLHGLGGDEKSMWVFEHALPPSWAVAAPRGLRASSPGGYSWAPRLGYARLPDFDGAVRRVESWLPGVVTQLDSDASRTLWMGFSQGAALAFAALLSGFPAIGLVSLAGFVPEGSAERLPGLPVFWAHGGRDQDVPIERARADVDRLQALGAEVEFCEADVDHRVGAPCLTALRGWLDRLSGGTLGVS